MAYLFFRKILPGTATLALSFVMAGVVCAPGLAQVAAGGSAGSSGTQGKGDLAAARVKPEPKKAKEAYKRGLKAEQDGDWQAAHEAYGDALGWDPAEREYAMRQAVAKGHLVQAKVDVAEREAISGRLREARKELMDAMYLDPGNRFVRDRLTELSAIAPDDPKNAPKEMELAGPVQLEYASGTKNFDYRGDVQGAYNEVATQFGVEVAFDVDLPARQVRFKIEGVDFPTAMRLLGNMSGTFWRPLAKHLFFVVQDTQQKRREYAEQVVRTVRLPASETPEQMTETLRVVRDITGITRVNLDTLARTITLRASPQAVAVASGLIDDLQKTNGELILEMEVLEVDRDYARNLGITPPQSTQIYALSSQEIQEAQASVQGLVNVITAVFGLPSALSGFSGSQITSLLSSGQVGVNTLLPPVIAFGGGDSTFLASVPGVAANFSTMLSAVEHGRRILLRAQDGQPATFFVGDRVPVELSSFSSSLSGTGTSIAGLSATNFPTTDYPVGTVPTFVATGSLRNNSDNDLVVSNFTDNTISVLLGAGDGTFGTQTTFATGTGPVWIATGIFRTGSSDQVLDVAVANQTANTISIFLGNGDGTFQTATTLTTGAAPSSVIAKNLHDVNGLGNLDLIVANHGDNTVYVYTGNGDGTFKAPNILQLPSGFGPAALATGDFNGDGHTDLVVADEGDAAISVFLGNGDGTFGPRTDYAVGNSPVYVATGDFNGDGVLDLAVANKTDFTVSVLFGNANATSSAGALIGNGTFSAQTIYPAGSSPTSIAVADYNIDGLQDLVVAASGDNSVSVLLNLGGGTFGPNFELAAGTTPVSIATADFNGDGKPDVVTANNGSANVAVILDSASFAGANGSGPFNDVGFPGVQYIDIGLKVKATPRIHLNNEVTLQLDFDISSLSGQAFNTIPVISNDTITQTVRVKENETAVLAGLLQHQNSINFNGTPGIATIPEIGLFAGDQNRQNQDQELLILVTPRMMRYAPRTDHTMYAGQGQLEGPGGGGAGGPANGPPGVPQPPPPAGAPEAPATTSGQAGGLPQPTTQVGTPIAPPPTTVLPQQPVPQQQPGTGLQAPNQAPPPQGQGQQPQAPQQPPPAQQQGQTQQQAPAQPPQ